MSVSAHEEQADDDRSTSRQAAVGRAASSRAPAPWPTEEEGVNRSFVGRMLIPLVVVGGVLLALGAMAAMVGIIVRIGRESSKEVVVTAQRDSASLRAETTDVFGKYDAARWGRGELDTVPNSEREEIVALFDLVKQCAVDEDHDRFKELCDFDRMLKRVDLTGNMAGWTYFDKRSWRGHMKTIAEAEPYWAQITVAGIVTPPDDPGSRIVYVYCDDAASEDPSECRFWIARDGGSWKFYDWARLDLGFSESQEWGLYAKYANSDLLKNFERWGDLIGEADAAIASGNYDGAKEKLRLAESQVMPPEFHDFHLVLTGYRWGSIDEMTEAERCYKSVNQPADTPGAYYGLLNCSRWDNAGEALGYAESYEEAVGPTPTLLEVKGQLLAQLHRDDDAARAWRRLLRIKPDHEYAAIQCVNALPLDSKPEFESGLEQLSEPVKLAVRVARELGLQDYERLQMIAEYVNRKSPESAAANYVTGVSLFLDGRYAEAAARYRAAFEGESDEETRLSRMNDYVVAMASDGKVVEALKSLPEAKSAFESVYYSYDEGELELTDDEIRQVIALHRQRHPNDLVAMHRAGSQAILDERYTDAERVLRQALSATGESDEETESHHASCKSLLTRAFIKDNRWKVAYEELGERNEQFATIARIAADDERWDVVRDLLSMHRTDYAEDPQILGVEGELAVHEKRWDDAVRLLRQALQAAGQSDEWRVKHLLMEAYVKSGRWVEHFKSSSDQGETFKLLTDRLIADEDWAAADELIGEYRNVAPDDVRITQQEAEVAWHRHDYDAFARIAQSLLNRDDESVDSYRQMMMENRLMSALLRSRDFESARQRALAEQRDNNDASTLAIVHAVEGDLAEAERLALEAARESESAANFYHDDEAGPVFLGDALSRLHEEFPVAPPYSVASVLAVFVFDEPLHLDAADLNAAMKELDIEVDGAIRPIESKPDRATAAIGVSEGDAFVWLATGGGKFNERWRLAKKSPELAEALEKSAGWLAVGTAGLTEPQRERVEELARRLGARMAGDRPVAAYLRGPAGWDYACYPANAELIAEWRASGKVKSFEDKAAALEVKSTSNVAEDREFERAVREHVRGFEETGGSRLEVVWYVSGFPYVDPVRMRVNKVLRTYGSLEFEGVLVNDSALVPELREGLPMRLDLDRIQEARLGDEKPILRKRGS